MSARSGSMAGRPTATLFPQTVLAARPTNKRQLRGWRTEKSQRGGGPHPHIRPTRLPTFTARIARAAVVVPTKVLLRVPTTPVGFPSPLGVARQANAANSGPSSSVMMRMAQALLPSVIMRSFSFMTRMSIEGAIIIKFLRPSESSWFGMFAAVPRAYSKMIAMCRPTTAHDGESLSGRRASSLSHQLCTEFLPPRRWACLSRVGYTLNSGAQLIAWRGARPRISCPQAHG